MKRLDNQLTSVTTGQLMTPRERVTAKDIMRIMGYEKNKAYRLYNQIRSAKSGPGAEFVFVDDLSAYCGFSRDTIKASMVS